MTRRVTRRHVLRVGSTGALAVGTLGLLSACAPTAPTEPPAKPAAPAPTAAAAKPAEAAKPTEATKPAAPAPAAAATTAPAPAKPADAPAAGKPAAAGDPKIGSSLVGTLEGPTVITDPAQFPKSFKEAPQLAEMVKAGTLPAVADRIGQDPLVIKPLKEIGKYGGTWRRGFTGPGDKWNGWRAATGPDHILFWDFTGEKIVPNIARDYKFEDGGKTLLISLRRGMKWSDGTPFTADAFTFWYEDIYLNKDLVPTGSPLMAINGKPGKIEKVDDVTVKYIFPEPYFFLADVLAGSTPLCSHAFQGLNLMGSFAPGHYLKQFLPKYAGDDAVKKLAGEAGFDNYVTLLKYKNDFTLNPDLPVVTPWKTVTPINTPNWVMERNPYSIWVDTDGNQLPYIDKVSMQLAENLEVVNLRAIAGEFDFQARHMDIGKLPVFLENQQRGNYKVYLDTGDYGGDMVIKFNMSYEADAELAKHFQNIDFRRALSLGIDRDQLNEAFWLGTGTPSTMIPADANKYNPGPEWRTKWATYDLKTANEMLDKAGLDKKDSEGYRLRTDGAGRLRLEIQTLGGQFIQYTRISEMIRDQWKRIGIDLTVQENERSLAERRNIANENQLYTFVADGSEHLFTFPDNIFPYQPIGGSGAQFATWFQSNGASGKEPPERMKRVMTEFKRAFGVQEEERIKIGQEIWKILTDDVYQIGVIGLSPAAMGVRIVKNTVGNVPSRQYNSPDGKTPAISRPTTFYFKS